MQAIALQRHRIVDQLYVEVEQEVEEEFVQQAHALFQVDDRGGKLSCL